MGLTTQRLIVKQSHKAPKKIEVKFLVDSGAIFSCVPAEMLHKIGIEPHRKIEFILADGRTIERQVGDAYFELNREGGAAPVIFGEAGDEPVLGAMTLESLGLLLDPLQRKLLPMRMLLASSTRLVR